MFPRGTSFVRTEEGSFSGPVFAKICQNCKRVRKTRNDVPKMGGIQCNKVEL